MNLKTWAYGLFSAMIGAAANTVTVMIVAPETFNLTLALVYFLAVRSCGWACFHYADRERDEHDLMAVLLGGEG